MRQAMTNEDAERFLIAWLRDPSLHRSGGGSYGYEIYVPTLIRDYLMYLGKEVQFGNTQTAPLSPYFFEAGWALCRRGILRPGVKQEGAQAVAEGGYCVTTFGRRWLEESDQDDYVPTEDGRFAEMLSPFQARLGAQFQERAQEAIRCYGAHAYLACCAMCGAATESALIVLSSECLGEDETLRIYRGAAGRARLEKKLLGQRSDRIRREFDGFAGLLKYWRDEASHGGAARIGDNEAFTSLALLLRFAKFVDDNWLELTSPLTGRGHG